MKYDVAKLLKLYDELGNNITKTAQAYCELMQVEYRDGYRRSVSDILNKRKKRKKYKKHDKPNPTENESITSPNNYNERGHFSAISPKGSILTLDEYCNKYNLDRDNIKSYKLITHTNVPYYNIVFYEQEDLDVIDFEEMKDIIRTSLKNHKRTPIINNKAKDRVGVIKVADLHLGAYVDNLIRTKNFSIGILADRLSEIAEIVNEYNFKEVHVHLLGDLIESFSGLNHKNSWKGLDKKMVGAEVVMLTVQILHENLLNRINNLSTIKVVAGNHDRLSADREEDPSGGAAKLVSWGLELLGYDVEFNPLVITHTVDGICHILTHGHHGLSKQDTKQLCWDYGVKGMYNLICEGHLHSIVQKLNVSNINKFNTIKDDSVDHMRFNCPSLFTGNFFSESLGYTSESRFVITYNNGTGIPNVLYMAV